MSTSSGNANIKELVDPLKMMSKSLTNNDQFREIKEFIVSFANKLNENHRNDEKLINYRQFFSEINVLDKKLGNFAESSDLSKLDALIELGKTNALITTGILKTTLEIKELLSSVSFNNILSKGKPGHVDNVFGSATHAKMAYDLARLFNVSERTSRTIALIVGGTSFVNSTMSSSDSESNKLNETLDDLSGIEAIASLLYMIPNPYTKLAGLVALSAITLDRLTQRYFPDERKAVIEYVWEEGARTAEKEIEESNRSLEKWKAFIEFIKKENVRMVDEEIEASQITLEKWKAFIESIQKKNARTADTAIEDELRAIDKWIAFGNFLAGIGKGLSDFKESESLRIANKAMEESSESINKWKAVGNFFSKMWNNDTQSEQNHVDLNSYLPFKELATPNNYNFTHTPNIIINVTAGTPEEIVNGVRNGVNSAALDIERRTLQIINGGQ